MCGGLHLEAFIPPCTAQNGVWPYRAPGGDGKAVGWRYRAVLRTFGAVKSGKSVRCRLRIGRNIRF